MKAAQMTREDEIRSISQKYEMDKEKVRNILERGVRYADADKAALFACMTGKKMEEILTVKKKTPKWKEWAEINLGVKPEDFSQWILETRNPALKPK